METAIEIDSDSSEMEDDTDVLVRDYLNDTRVESQQAKRQSHDLVYSPEQLENIAFYKKAITLNRQTEATYKKLEDSLIRMLTQVRNRLKDNEAALLKQSNNSNEGGFNYLRCGKPYFKDKNCVPAPENEDTIIMRQAQMYDFSVVCSVPGWTVKDKTELVSALLEMSRNIKRKELRSEISQLRHDKRNIIRIANLEREINQLNKKTLAEVALPLDQEYDWELLANSMNRRHTEQEYQALWKLFFHPSINKSSWTKTEQQELRKIASAHNKQDWDSIAKQLNTGRTGYQCFVYYRTNMVDNSSNSKWTIEEMEYLQRVVEYFREGRYIPWGKVASAMDRRTKIQVYNKYTRMVERRKGRFLEEEDVVLLNCYDKYGDDFKKISEYLPGRSAMQLKTRFHILTKFRLSTTWSVQDDRKLLQIMANLNSNTNFSSATKFFPGKDRTNIRSRYVTLMKWTKAHPASDISMAPRRGARRLLHSHASISLKDAIANLNKRIQTEVNTKKKKRITLQSHEEDIDDGIMALLINEILREETNKKPDQPELCRDNLSPLPYTPTKNISNLRNLLIFLNASFDKDKFQKSKYAEEYSGLSEMSPKESFLKVKSYSKSTTVHTIEMDDFPDIWSKKMLRRTSYVLPPNYASMTGCLMLMKHFGTKPAVKLEDDINLSLMQRQNMFLRQSIETLKERFTVLFMWPMMLSNEMPNITETPYVSRPVIEKKSLPHPTGLTIPKPKTSQLIFQAKQAAKFRNINEDEIDEPKQEKIDFSEIRCSSGMPESPGISTHSSENDDSLH